MFVSAARSKVIPPLQKRVREKSRECHNHKPQQKFFLFVCRLL